MMKQKIMKNNTLCVTDIQKYSIHDGKGIRTTVFFKGCPLRCKWCHNPETQSYEKQLMFYAERCTGCGACVAACNHKAVTVGKSDDVTVSLTDYSRCRSEGNCIDVCVNNAREICGKEYTVSGIVREVRKDMAFYDTSGGGVTLSGGEVLSQNADNIQMLVKSFSDIGISVYIDTCGCVPYENIEKVIPYTDVFLYDLKIMDSDVHEKYKGVTNELIKENLIRLSGSGSRIWLRIPMIGGVNDTDENISATADFLKKNNIMPEQIHLLPYHSIGKDKYKRLGIAYDKCFGVPDEEKLDELKNIFYDAGFNNVFIGG